MKFGPFQGKRWLSLLLTVSLLLGNVPFGAFATEETEETPQVTEAPAVETQEATEDITEATEETEEITEATEETEETTEATEKAEAVQEAQEHVHDYQFQEKAPTCTEPGYRGKVCTLCGDVQPDPVTTDITAAFQWTDGTMIQATSGNLMTHSTWMASDYVNISGCDQIRIITADTVTADSTIGLAFYDESKTYLSGVRHTDSTGDTYGILVHELTVPENAAYIRSTWYSKNHPGYEASFGDFSCSVTGEFIPATGHSYSLTGHRDATCTAEGADVYTCTLCGHSYEEPLPKGDHSIDGGVCTLCGYSDPEVRTATRPEDTSFRLTLTPMDYLTVSRDETEKLACAPGLVALENGKFAVSYLADDSNTVETESSTTIVCRLGFFDLKDPEQGTFFDVAKAGQTVGGVTIGNKAPYEPNLLKLSEKELLVLFNIRDTSGNYIYYSARFDTGSNTVTAYQPLTLDGAPWTPANIAASYNALAETDISTAGPAGSMVFTSQIIQQGGYYYGYCGGICAGFSGILVRSTDGINWTSVMVPEALPEMAGVIECGFRFLDDYVYFCMRDISSGVYHCSYNFTTGQQLTRTVKLSGLTTSKPAAFIQDGKLYLIVNKATGDDSTVGRRNTALFYQVDPETCRLSQARQVFCADGVAYHSVVNVSGTNYWCFHTDARRINPYTQGRSNLAFRKIPALYAAESSTDGVLNLQNYGHMYAQGCITGSANAWQAGAVNMHYQILLADFAGFDGVTITANARNKAYLAFFTDWMSKEGGISYAEGWTEQLILEPGTSCTLPIPEDAQYLYILATNAAGDSMLPANVQFIRMADAAKPLALQYDDHYDITGKTVEIIEAGIPTSYQVGYGVAENAVPDTAVVTLEGDALVATGIGDAQVRIDGTLFDVTVTAAPINLLLLIGQSNMEGNEGEAKQSISCPDGMVYATYGDRYDMVLENATHYAPSALTGQYRTVNTVGGTDGLSDYPVYMLTYEGDGRKGPDSGFAYEWVQQTGEKVWIVNASHGGTSLNVWQPGTTQYEECQAMFGACAETLRREIAAGHFTLNHMAYFWCQGCNDYDKTAKWYVENYLTMHESLKQELAFDHDSDAATPDRTFEFGGIIPVRVGHSWRNCYRDGIYPQTNPYSYYESYEDLRLSGPRVAQYWMTNNPELPELWNVCTIGEDWVWMPDGTNGVTDYFQSHYPGGTVDYDPQVKQAESWYTPTTPNAVHDSIHYNQIGYNEVGREAVRNALILMGLKPDYEEQTTVTLVNWTGFESVDTVPASTQGRSATLVVPIIRPVTRTKQVTFTLTEGLRWDYYDLLADSVQREGKLTAGTGETVTVVKQAPGEYLADHLRQLPETVCRGVNLWNTLERDSQYFTVNGWGKHTSGQVYSLTVPVKAGDRIYATSFGPAGENGNNADGIRCTFFGEYEVIRTMAPAEVYSEFAANGYLTAPEGAIAVNVPMWNTEDTNELYLLSLPHDESESICSICGKNSHVHSFGDWETVTLPSQDGPGIESRSCACGESESREVPGVWQTLELGKYLVSLPETYCGGTDLWPLLPHTQTYFHSGTHWDTNTAADVWAVTIPASAGDRIFATSFGSAGENNYTSAGIRVTFFDAYGIGKTLTPSETYAEFKAKGYLTAPEGTVAVNVPMYGNAGNELKVLSVPHSWVEETAVIRSCSLCGQAEGGYRIDAPGEEVWIDGVKYTAREDKDGKFVLLEGKEAKTLVVYSYKDAAASDPHSQYPTGMQVWRLRFENGSYVSTYIPEFDDLLQYAGASIRVKGVKGIRMITGIDKALRAKLMNGTLGYTLVEYGTAVTWAKDGIPVLGKGYTMSNFAYKRDVADPIFAETDATIQYTNVLVGFTDDQLGTDLMMRPYMILEDGEGERITIYGGCVQRSIGYIAKQNQSTFPEGSKADAYIEDIISKVYG